MTPGGTPACFSPFLPTCKGALQEAPFFCAPHARATEWVTLRLTAGAGQDSGEQMLQQGRHSAPLCRRRGRLRFARAGDGVHHGKAGEAVVGLQPLGQIERCAGAQGDDDALMLGEGFL